MYMRSKIWLYFFFFIHENLSSVQSCRTVICSYVLFIFLKFSLFDSLVSEQMHPESSKSMHVVPFSLIESHGSQGLSPGRSEHRLC